ncbi:arginase [Mucilaginibacter sp. UYP25]|uniref:arginase family protein n=1 Tax=unclassified Mucilaginibacter TaxID=2617802 RepID=UPI0033946C23
MQKLIIIEAPTNLGLKQLNAVEPGVNKLPRWLKQHGLYNALQPQNIFHVAAPPYRVELDEESGVLNADAIVAYSKKLSAEITAALTAKQFPLVIGGDCSILIGCALGLKSLGNYGLFFLDGHTDYVTPAFSETKAVAGMDLAIVSGNGPDKLTNINSLHPYFEQANVFAVGNRCLEDDYVNLITNSNVNYYPLHAVRKQGINNIVSQFLEKTAHLNGFWIHLDLDVLENEVMPCVDSPQPGGLTYPELFALLSPLFRSPKVAGINITILDPNLDPEGIYTSNFIKYFVTLFGV